MKKWCMEGSLALSVQVKAGHCGEGRRLGPREAPGLGYGSRENNREVRLEEGKWLEERAMRSPSWDKGEWNRGRE